MRQEESYTYKDFYFESRVKPRKTEEAQKKAILKNLEELSLQKDYWSLEAIRLLIDQLKDEEKKDRGDSLLFYVQNLITATDEELKNVGYFIRAYRDLV